MHKILTSLTGQLSPTSEQLQSATLSLARAEWCNEKNHFMKTLACQCVHSVFFFFTAVCSNVFFTGDPRSNLCHYQSARISWCHPDAPSWNTHRLLCLLPLRCRHTQMHVRFTSWDIVYIHKSPLSDADAAMSNNDKFPFSFHQVLPVLAHS